MVIKGNARGGAAQLAAHLARTDTNELMEVVETRGTLADDLHGALVEIEAVASGCRSQRPLYHASLNTRADELLSPAQRDQALDRLEDALGFTGQPRVVVAHTKEGRAHFHCVWSRIDLETMTAIPDSFNYRRHEEVARELERAFGHARVQGAHAEREGQERPARTPSQAEMQQAERASLSPAAMKAAVTELWRTTDSGQALAAAIADQGWILARGDRRDFVIVDDAGEVHSLARRIDGAKAKDVRERLADVDPATLPGVAEARSIQAERETRRKATGGLAAIVAELDAQERGRMVEPYTDKLAAEQAQRLAALLEEADRIQRVQWQFAAQADQATKHTAQGQDDHTGAQAKEQAERQAELLKEAERQEAARKAFLDEAERTAKEARRADAERMSAGDVTNANSRYAEALGEHYDMTRPYQSLARAAMAEYGKFAQQQEQLRQAAAKETDPEARLLIEMRRQIEGADYMAITSQRLAGISDVVAGRVTEQGIDYRIDAKEWADKAAKLREQRAELLHQRDEQKRGQAKDDEPQDKARQQHNEKQTAPGARPQDKPFNAATATRAEKDAELARRDAAHRRQREENERKRQQSNQPRPGGRGR